MEKVSLSSSSSSSSSAAVNNGGPDSFKGLKFRRKIHSDGGRLGPGRGPAPASPAKRLRAGFVQGSQRPRCQVEGCGVDLSDAKAYYSRHKVCGMHSKFAKVIVSGLEQRFCQQCSRFHLLPEFDEGKRSCRRRLAGHNERRRKPQQRSLLSPRHGTLFPSLFADNNRNNKTGGFVMDFSNYKFPSETGRNSFPDSTPEWGGLPMNLAAVSAKTQVPMPSNQQNPMPDFLTSGPNYSCSVVSECFSGSSNCNNDALSLLSNQAWAGPKAPLGLNNNFLSQQPESPSPVIGQFIYPSWDFKGNEGNEMLPDLGLGQGGYNVGLGLGQLNDGGLHELDQSRGYGSSVEHVPWSL